MGSTEIDCKLWSSLLLARAYDLKGAVGALRSPGFSAAVCGWQRKLPA